METFSIDDLVVRAMQVIEEGFKHKNYLLKAFTSYLIATGQDKYVVPLEHLESLTTYGLSYTVDRDAGTLTIEVKRPTEEFIVNDNVAGKVH